MTLVHPVEVAEAIIDRAASASMVWKPMPGQVDVGVKTLWRDGGSYAGVMCLGPGAHLNAHTHHEAAHHAWIVSGSCIVEGRELTAGSYMHVPAGLPHGIDVAGPDGCEMFYLYLKERS